MIALPVPERVEEFEDHLGLLSFVLRPILFLFVFPSFLLSFLNSFFVSSDSALPTTTGPGTETIGSGTNMDATGSGLNVLSLLHLLD